MVSILRTPSLALTYASDWAVEYYLNENIAGPFGSTVM
jgi:hypothetical protein